MNVKPVLLAISIVGSICLPDVFSATSCSGIGDLPGATFYSAANGVSGDGLTVVGRSFSSNGGEGFRWTQNGGIIGLGDLAADGYFASTAMDASGDGSTIVGSSYSSIGGRQVGFRWTLLDGMLSLGDLDGGNYESYAWSVSDDGSVVAGYAVSANGDEAFRWTQAGGMVGLGFLETPRNGVWSRAAGVSGDGSTIVGYSVGLSNQEAFRWTSGSGMVGLGGFPGETGGSGANDVSQDGSVIVGYAQSGSYNEAFRWTQSGGMVGLGRLSGDVGSEAVAVSADGKIIVGYSMNSEYAYTPFIWDNMNGMRSLADLLVAGGADLSGYTLLQATDISADGTTIVGVAKDSIDRNVGFISVVDRSTNTQGVPIPWLEALGYTNDFELAALADPDEDGFLNWQEYHADTNPTNALSYLFNTISIAAFPMVDWFASSNCIYGVSYTDNLASNTWSSLSNNIPGMGAVISVQDTNNVPARCYRVDVRLKQ